MSSAVIGRMLNMSDAVSVAFALQARAATVYARPHASAVSHRSSSESLVLYTGTPVLPNRIDTIETLEDLLSEPTSGLLQVTGGSTGDLVVLGAGGKMGP